MYQTSEEYKSLVYKPSTRHLLKVYIDGSEVNPKYILDFKMEQSLFENEGFSLGAVSAKSVELKLYKDAVPQSIETIYITSGINEEIVPIGYFHVESMEKEDDYTVLLKLMDNMTKFEFNYDGSSLVVQENIQSQEELEGELEDSTIHIKSVSLLELTQDICRKGGVELRFYFFFEYGYTSSCL